MHGHLVDGFFLVFSGAAVLATLALFTRQPILVAYIAIGSIAGPFGLGYVADAGTISDMAEIGIIFLLFLLGLDMQPRALVHLLRESAVVGAVSSVIFFAAGAGVALLFGLPMQEAVILGAAAMFSSTIIGIKLLPTTVLHHRHVGELVVSLLLLQDLLAIVTLLVLGAATATAQPGTFATGLLLLPFVMLPLLIAGALLTVKFVVLPLLARFDTFHEFIFLLAIGWCLALAVLAKGVGLSWEMGAFIAGVSLASSQIAQYIAESLRPLRDFFLVLFFFSVGAGFNLALLPQVIVPAVVLSALLLLLKPAAFSILLGWEREDRATRWEVGWRLGQLSEFSLMIAYMAAGSGLLSVYASHVLQLTAIATFVASSYLVVFRYPSPIAPQARLRRN